MATDPATPPPAEDSTTGCLSPDDALTLCGGEAGTESARLHGHIEACERCRLLVAEAARAMVDVGRTRTSRLLTLSEGEQVGGRYRIVRFLARGGMGEVYEAFDDLLQENVALKTLVSGALDDDRAVARLAVEVRLARKVTHPNVCRLLEFGLHAPAGWQGARLPFMTMELLAGQTLSQRITSAGPLPLDEALDITRQLVAGLAAIHAAEIVHRDFKSDNAFLARSPAGGQRVVVMDFGLAHAPVGSATRPFTSGSLIAGTADYVAPEQLSGEPVTARADIYALGVVLFEMVTGHRPFSAESPFITAVNRLRLRPPLPSSLRPGLPAAWDEAILSCLARQPADRFATVQDLLPALESGRDAPAARRRAQRRRRLAGTGALAAALATAVTWAVVRRPPVPATPVTPTAVAAPRDLPPEVPVLVRSVMQGLRWPVREIPVCIEKVEGSADPPAEIFEVRAMLDFSWGNVGDFWFGGWEPCPRSPRGIIALSLEPGSHQRADLGYRPEGPTRVHLGIQKSDRYDRVVTAFGRAMGLGLRGSRYASPEEIVLVQSEYGRRPPGSLTGAWGRCLSATPGSPRLRYTRCTGSADTTWRPDRENRQLRLDGPSAVCLGVGQRQGKQPVTASDCNRGARDRVPLQGMTWRVFGGRCMAATAPRDRAEIHVGDCEHNPKALWDFWAGDDRIRLHGSNLCVTSPPDSQGLGSGVRLSLRRCGQQSAGIQQFQYHPGGIIRVVPGVDLCLGVFGEHDLIQLGLMGWCNRQPFSATSAFHLEGPIRLGGGCLTVAGAPDDPTPAWAQPCVGNWNHQSWQYHW